MNDNIAIHVNHLIKTYRLYDTHADRVREAFHPFRRKYHHSFNALSDVSFQVRQGETLGIIGRNGSGKSTLLQIVCGVLRATAGSVEVNGRISALLELGAGFNPQFSGRENVYINGSILGLRREEIDARFDDIAAFADIGDFINQPVKSYSSGMVVRLAFAIAISIDPDILIVDEALAVGDEAFQRKCFARIKEIQENGGTILFVSHGAGTIIELCNRALLLDQGELLIEGAPKQVVSYYHKMIFAPPEKIEEIKSEWRGNPNRLNLVWDEKEEESDKNRGNGVAKKKKPAQESFYVPDMVPKSTIYYERRGTLIDKPHITTLDGRKVNVLVHGEEYIYTYSVFFEQPAFQVRFGMLIKTLSGFEIGGAATAPAGEGVDYVESETCWNVKFYFRCLLNPGVYFLNAGVLGILNGAEEYLDRNVDIAMFRVQKRESLRSTAIVDFIKHVDVSMAEDIGNRREAKA
ncbi:MAG: ABC transporter ATP-binding protein [Desulfatiglans sp.]|jgi:lipopolysaccharide transport system ATP-binding protein|nr:ABC transporter ATP-binding protein [Desulfatiglans sp.]